MDNEKETQKDIKTTRIERLTPYRFTSANQPAKRGRHKGSSPTDYLKKLSRTKIDFHNPLTGKTDRAPVSLIVAIQLVLKATQDSDLPSIKEYFDRLDGKIPQVLEHSGEIKSGETKVYVINKIDLDERVKSLRENALSMP